jgi:2-methylcitrate dehydratase
VTKPSWDDHKFKPVNKETADHSFYYCTAVGLVAGDCTSEQFNDRWLQDADVARLMALCTLEAKPELTALFKQGGRPAAVEVKTARGVFHREVLYPKGDPNNPMTWDDVTRKFRKQSEAIITPAVADEIVTRVSAMERETDMRDFARLLGATGR